MLVGTNGHRNLLYMIDNGVIEPPATSSCQHGQACSLTCWDPATPVFHPFLPIIQFECSQGRFHFTTMVDPVEINWQGLEKEGHSRGLLS